VFASSHVLWRRPPKFGAHTPIVVLLHGRGADETDLIDVADRLPRNYAYASLRAPVPVEGGGYTWFDNRGPARPIAASVRASIAGLRAWLDDGDAGCGRRECYLFGFSAGMMMAGALLLDDPARFAGSVLLSGALPLDAMPPEAVADRLTSRRVFYGRGSEDAVIPSELVTRTETYLRDRSGADLTLRTYAHGHAISKGELTDVATWFAQSP
jgi:phospholipase/carboxylesterase